MFKKLIIGILLFVFSTTVSAQNNCLKPTNLTHRVHEPARLNYKFIGGSWTDATKQCVIDAFYSWNIALRQGNRKIQFISTPFRPVNISIVRSPLPVEIGGALTDIKLGDKNYFQSSGLIITSDTQIVNNCSTIYKITLHEIGHILGLADFTYNKFVSDRPIPSVMNAMGGNGDDREFIPLFPTVCDINAIP